VIQHKAALVAEPYVSRYFLRTMKALRIPTVPATPWAARTLGVRAALKSAQLNLSGLKSPKAALYTNSEEALDFALSVAGEQKRSMIELFKSKGGLRERLQAHYPGFSFQVLSRPELARCAASPIGYPVVLKPDSGFFSTGIRIVRQDREWRSAVDSLLAELARIKTAQSRGGGFSRHVINPDLILVEDLIEGDEYAADAFFDISGTPVILNVFKHPHCSSDDVSHRLYYTSTDIVHDNASRMLDLLDRFQDLQPLQSLPLHLEVREAAGAELIPIEVNPLRFAGWCTTELADWAYGINPYRSFFNFDNPWRHRVRRGAASGRIYGFVVAYCPPDMNPVDIQAVKWGQLRRALGDVIEFRRIDYRRWGVLAVAFVRRRVEADVTPLASFETRAFIRCKKGTGLDPHKMGIRPQTKHH